VRTRTVTYVDGLPEDRVEDGVSVDAIPIPARSA